MLVKEAIGVDTYFGIPKHTITGGKQSKRPMQPVSRKSTTPTKVETPTSVETKTPPTKIKGGLTKKKLIIGALGTAGLISAGFLGKHLYSKHKKLQKRAQTDLVGQPADYSSAALFGALGTAGIGSTVLQDYINRSMRSPGKARIVAALAGGIPSVGALAYAYKKLRPDPE